MCLFLYFIGQGNGKSGISERMFLRHARLFSYEEVFWSKTLRGDDTKKQKLH